VTAITERPAADRTGHDSPRNLMRSAAVPLICVVVLLGLLTAWVVTGGAGTLTRVRLQITQAAVPMRSFTPRTATGAASTFLTIKNLTGTADELLAVTSPIARRVVLTSRVGPAGSPAVVSDLVIPAHGTLTLSPFGDDVVLRDPASYETRSTVPLTLTFRQAGTVTIAAAVTAPGTPLPGRGWRAWLAGVAVTVTPT
jgi:copper(I)-binding protein